VTRIERLALRDVRWASFVAGFADRSPFHLPEWTELLCECYSYRGFAVGLPEGDALCAGMPVIERRSPLKRRPTWISLPFTDYCPPLVTTPDAEAAFADAVTREHSTGAIDRAEVRGSLPMENGRATSSAVRHILPLGPDADAVLAGVSKSESQHAARAKRRGVTVREATTAEDADHVFYALQLDTRRRLGVPIQPRRFYRLLWKRMLSRGHGLLLLAYHDDEPIAGAIFLRANTTLVWKFGASLRSHWSLRANPLILWTAIEHGCATGATLLDFGRTELSHEGLRVFKRSWGTDEVPLFYSVLGGPKPRRVGSDRPRRAAEEVIRRTPAWVCRLAGEMFYKYAS
jgi:CelD/BcsL family acetyltransferase involved in cellulose biosynthesis